MEMKGHYKPDNNLSQNPSENNLHVEIYGTGINVVLVHGWAMHSGIWRDFAKRLAKNFKVICIDLPGHGRSDKVHPFTLQQISEALLKAVPEGSCCWLGWSMGATVVLDLAHRFPDQVGSLILLAGNPHFVADGDWPGMPVDLLEVFAKGLKNNCQSTLLRFLGLQVQGLPDSRSVLAKMKKKLFECDMPDEKTLQGGLDILKYADLRPALTEIKKPVMLVLGDRDKLVPIAAGNAVKQLASETEVHVIEGAGHVPFLTHGEEFVPIVSNFIDQHERSI